MPEPTRLFAVAADNWSPAPTAAPRFSIFGRDALQANEGSTFGYVSGLSASPVACPNSQIWATNTYFGVHGCCPSSNLSACTIHTTCIASTAMSAFCTDDACSSNSAAAKCTASTAQECYKYLIDYGSTIMTQHGCTYSGFTSTIPHTYGLTSTPFIIITVTAPPVSTSTSIRTSSSTGNSGGEKKHSLGPIVGGTIGGCTILSLVALAAFVIHRRRSKLKTAHRAAHPPPISQYQHDGPTFDPHGFQTTNGWTEQDIKTWQHTAGVDRPATGQYVGVSEVHGEDRAVEVEAPEKTKSGHWTVPGVAPVEAEARLVRK
ncbi:uncharacterized protein M421DRAFT_3689 [Didymella exigua CBS 183.55]|uniref:Mid2 domain-containing protein n=1 Tax=Didymella exigua CBS 183.55 TaxID=1150837 RepID=A0A6A5RND0_9PLEO|nr:uncharacterized protein M421DRAFT_3689 [Didymella exigua CBS 183.55]KAF1929911.1 hypothetical protein M421DRAFT_3689 [Didymella exigua CBS 183.55]